MGEYAKLSQAQWEAIALAQERYGLPDRLAAAIAGCGVVTVCDRRNGRTRSQKPWAVRKLPDRFLAGAGQGGAAGETDDGTSGQPGRGDGAETALARLLAMIVKVTADAGKADANLMDLKRLDALTNAAKSFEKLMEMKARMAPAAGPQEQDAEQTAKVLAQIDRRVDELADRRARHIIAQCCRSGECRAELPAGR